MRMRITIVATATALVTLAAVALAETGDLTPRNCFNDRGGLEDCGGSNQGLDGAFSVAVSPDGKSVYVASLFDDALVTYDRNPLNGKIAPAGCIDDNDTGPDKCAQTTNGLDGPASVAVSADNKSVYVASAFDDAVVAFARNLTTGELTPQGCVDDNDSGADACAQSADGLDQPTSVAVSTNNNSVYVASQNDSAVARFARNTTTGALTPQGCVEDNDFGPDACAQSADGLGFATGVTVSPNNTSVYVVSQSDNAIVRFARNASTGALTPQDCVEDEDFGLDNCAQQNDGLGGAFSVAVSPDNTSVYVAGQSDNAISRFARNPTTGALTPKGCIDDRGNGLEDCFASARGLDGVIGVTVSPDSKSVYAAGRFDDAIAAFERNLTTGSLVPDGCVDDNDTGPDLCAQTADGLDEPRSVAVSKDGKSVYVASAGDDAIVRFNRAP